MGLGKQPAPPSGATHRKETERMAEIVIGQSCPVRSNCTPLPENPVPAMAYVPCQQWGQTFEPERAGRRHAFPRSGQAVLRKAG